MVKTFVTEASSKMVFIGRPPGPRTFSPTAETGSSQLSVTPTTPTAWLSSPVLLERGYERPSMPVEEFELRRTERLLSVRLSRGPMPGSRSRPSAESNDVATHVCLLPSPGTLKAQTRKKSRQSAPRRIGPHGARASPPEVTPSQGLEAGGPGALESLIPLVYGDSASDGRAPSQENGPATLQPTAIVNEAYLRLVGNEGGDWQNRAPLLRGGRPVDETSSSTMHARRNRRSAASGDAVPAGHHHHGWSPARST